MRKIRLGIIGAGLIVRGAHVPALRTLHDRFEIVAVCSRSRASAESLARTIGDDVEVVDDADTLLRYTDVEAVDIAVPIVLNAPIALAAAAAGKHVFLEKPIAATVQDGADVAGLPRRYGIVLLVAENHRYDPAYMMARRLMDEGAVGEPRLLQWDSLLQMRADNPYSQTAWRQQPGHIGGYLSDGGVHAVASLRILGGPIARVSALTTSFNPSLLGDADTMLLHLAYDSGLIGNLVFSVGAPEHERRPLVVYGTEGRLELGQQTIGIQTPAGRREIALPVVDPFVEEFLDFYHAIVDGTPVRGTPAEALADLQVIDAALRSAGSHQVVRVRA